MLVNGRTAIDGLFAPSTASTLAARADGAVQHDVKDPDRLGDILELLLAPVLEGQIQLVADMLADRLRHGDAAGPGDAFEPRRDVDPVAEQVVALDDDIAEIDPDPELDPPVLGNIRRCAPASPAGWRPRIRPR